MNKLFNTKTKLFAVTGNPILHSKSPFLFNSIFEHQKIDAYYFRLAAGSAKKAIDFVKKYKIQGINVTSPFKQEMLTLVDVVDTSAQEIGSINTITNLNGILTGYNTDFLGVINSFKEKNINIRNQKCLVIGAGGAARAVVYGLTKAEADVTIVNRTKSKAVQIAKQFSCSSAKIEDIDKLITKNNIILSALIPKIIPFNKKLLTSEHIVFDANYKNSDLTKIAELQKCTIINAQSWLIHQAVPAFYYFLKQEPNIDIMYQAFSKSLISKEKLKILTLTNENISFGKLKTYSLSNLTKTPDMIVCDENEDSIKQKINEEINQTFAY